MHRILILLLLLPVAARADEPTQEDLLRLEKKLQSANANVAQSLACVVVSRSDKYPKADGDEAWQLGRFDRAAFLKAKPTETRLAAQLDLSDVESIPDHGFAGGVVLDSSGLILTTHHAIEGATRIYVHLTGGKGSYADIRAADSRTDLAVLKLLDPPAGLKAIRIGTVRLQPTSDTRETVSAGTVGLLMALPYTSGTTLDRPRSGLATVSQIRKPEVKVEVGARFSSIYNYAPTLAFESKLNPGASGSALLNLDGELIGLTTTTAALPPGESGHGYALPIDNHLTRILEVLRRGEEVEYGFLGVTQNPQLGPRGRGIHVQDLAGRSSPAALADMRPGDMITRINDMAVTTFEDLLLHVGHSLAGRKITLQVQRGLQTKDITLTLAKFKNEVPFIASVKPEPVFGLRVEYGSVLLQMQFNPFFGGRTFTDVPAGVLAREPLPDTPAAAKFKDLGDNARWIVTHVNGRAVAIPSDFYREAAGAKSVTLTVVDANDALSRTREVKLP